MTIKVRRIISIAIVLMAIAVFAITAGVKKDDDLVNQSGRVCYEYVNFREEPKVTSDIIGVLKSGTKVTYTGNSKEYYGGTGRPEEYWVEVTTAEGMTGWVVNASVRKSVS